MSVTIAPTTTNDTVGAVDGSPSDLSPSTTDRRRIWTAGVVAGVLASVATSASAAIARASGADLAIDGEQIPISGFAMLTMIGAVVGVAIAKVSRRARRPRTTFVRVTATLTGLSIIPDLVADATWGSRLVLAATHVIAALVIVPALAQRIEP